MHLKQDFKDLQRLERILVVFFEEGLGYYIMRSPLSKHLPLLKKLTPVQPLTDTQMQAIRLRRAFERLGSTFVKLGQLLSLRPDLVPAEYSKEFEKLQDHIPAFSFSHVQKIVEEDLGKPLTQLFKHFDLRPLASASIAQVHRATLKNGKKVVVKVQRPDIKEKIDADLDLLFYLARSLEKYYPELRNYRPVEVVKEFALWTRKELNFEIEAQHALRLQEVVKDNPQIKVPEVYPEYSSKRVLTLEYVEGVKIDNLAALEKYQVNRKTLAMTYFTSILEQALLYGFFHADPHPANIFVQKNGKLVYLDYGIMGELDLDDRKKIIQFIESISEKNVTKSLNVIISLARDTHQADLDEFKRETLLILSEVYKHSIKERSVAKALYQVISLGARYGVIFDPNHVLMAKAMYQAEGLGLKLHPHFKIAEGLEIFYKQYLQQRYSLSRMLKTATQTVWDKKDLLLDFPDHLLRLMEKIEKHEDKHEFNPEQIKELEQEMEFIARKRTMAILVVLLILGASFLLFWEGKRELWGLPLSFLLFFLALGIFVYSLLLHKGNEVDTSWKELQRKY